MSLRVKVKQEVEFPPVPEGTYTAICYTIADLGMQYNDKFKKLEHKILFIWEIVDDEQRIEIDGEKKRRAISKQYTASFATKSNMYKDIRPWLGREFTQEEQDGSFYVGELIGKPCLLNVIHDTSGEGKTYAKVAGIMQLPKGLKVGEPENPTVLYDMDESTDEELAKLPEWVQDRISKSQNAELSKANGTQVTVDPETGEVSGDLSGILEDEDDN